jgi:enoyl-CoA hydratase/carnithine racemase
MPAVYVRMLFYAWGEPVAARTSLLEELFTSAEAYALGLVHELAPVEELLDRAVAVAEQTPEDCSSSTRSPSGPARPPRCATSPTSPTRATAIVPTA